MIDPERLKEYISYRQGELKEHLACLSMQEHDTTSLGMKAKFLAGELAFAKRFLKDLETNFAVMENRNG